MKRIIGLLIFITAIGGIFYAFKASNQGDLTIRIQNIELFKGSISIVIFKNEDGWPNEYKKAVFSKAIPATSKEVNQVVKGLPYGKYAIAVLHDINNNKEADKNMIGIPKEPFGFSNYLKISFGEPDFEDVAFTLKSPKQEVVIKLMEI